MGSNLKDLFTERNSIQDSLYNDNMLSKYAKKSNKELYDLIYSPVKNYNDEYLTILKSIEKQSKIGKDHILFHNYQKYLGCGLSDNIIIPYLDIHNLVLTDLILLSNPNDSERIAKKHIKKMPNFKPLLYDSIISTTDSKHWKNQRLDLVQAFSPSDLNNIMEISNRRASKCSDLLWKISKQGIKEVNMSDFFLNETMAQLQLAMFGVSDKFQKETNTKIRAAFGGKGKGYARKYALKLIDEIKKSNGPLSDILNERKPETNTELYGNALILSFAGHDTTGHTLTWLVYELAKNQSWQRKLQREVDQFWKDQKNKKITTKDFKRLHFMTRCIMETLRLHTAVPNGTFRELIEDEIIMGKNGKNVNIPKGTYVQIFNYSRHLNPELWGEDSYDFNPNREFRENEIWNNEGHAFYNPSSDRFSPFTYAPRDCIGKNFAQLEMRLILLNIFKNYHFILDEKQNEEIFNNIEVNKATMGPMDIYDPINYHNKGFRPFNNGMYVKIIKRKIHSRL